MRFLKLFPYIVSMEKEAIERAVRYLEILLEQNEMRYQNNLKAIETTRRQTAEEVNRILSIIENLFAQYFRSAKLEYAIN